MAEEIGARLRDARRRVRLSQTTVAKFIGTTRQTIAAVERGKRPPNLRELVGFANLYRVTLDEMMSRAESPARSPEIPRFQPRFNKMPELGAQDREELVAFDQYLHQRPAPGEAVQVERRAFEPMADLVARIRSEAEPPVPIFGILANKGIEVRFTALDELAGATLLAEGDYPNGILINSDQLYERQRWSGAHELGHLLLGHQPTEQAFLTKLGRRFEPQEVDADRFAAELLLPQAELQRKAAEIPDGPVEEQVYRLAGAFMVSFKAMTMRLANIGALGPGAVEFLTNQKPSEIAERLEKSQKRPRHSFRTTWLLEIAQSTLPAEWTTRATAETVRLLQEVAYSEYVRRVPESDRSDSAGGVYEKVSIWFATNYPVVRE